MFCLKVMTTYAASAVTSSLPVQYTYNCTIVLGSTCEAMYMKTYHMTHLWNHLFFFNFFTQSHQHYSVALWQHESVSQTTCICVHVHVKSRPS